MGSKNPINVFPIPWAIVPSQFSLPHVLDQVLKGLSQAPKLLQVANPGEPVTFIAGFPLDGHWFVPPA